MTVQHEGSPCPIKEEDVTIVKNTGDCKTHWTVEITTRFSKKEAVRFYNYISLYHIARSKLDV